MHNYKKYLNLVLIILVSGAIIYKRELSKYGPLVKWFKTPPFHGGNTGSNPVGVTILEL